MDERVLFVDDEQAVLDTFKRMLHKKLTFDTAGSGREALDLIAASEQPFAVVVADQQMPGMSGTALLAEIRERWPDTVRIMLTGMADLTIAMDAVNEGNIFRFLTKPCPPQVLYGAVQSAIEQYRLVTAEKELLGKTLRGSVKVLTELLSLTSPLASGKTTRIQHYVRKLTQLLNLEEEWKYDLAAMLSQIGCITLPLQIVDKVYSGEKLGEEEEALFQQHPNVAKKLIANIPRLQAVAYMIASQLKNYSEFPPGKTDMPFVMGSQLIRVANDFDTLIIKGMHPSEALHFMERQDGVYNPQILRALEKVPAERSTTRLRTVGVAQLNTHMAFDQNVTARNGLVLVRKGMEVTFTVIEMLRSFNDGIGVKEPIRVIEFE